MLCLQEDSGRLKFLCYANDGIDEHMIWYSFSLISVLYKLSHNKTVWSDILCLRLIGLKNIFARQLPNMPKEYIARLVMDR